MSKIKAVEIWLNRAEGPTKETGEVTVRSFEEADRVLRRWARTAPKPGRGYDKTDFKVTYADGETYEGRYDLVYEDHKKKSLLGNHIQGFLLFHAGLRRPGHLTAEQYDRHIAEMDVPAEEYLEFLRKYET